MRLRWPIWVTAVLLVLSLALAVRVLRRPDEPAAPVVFAEAPAPAPAARNDPAAADPTVPRARPRRARIPIPRLQAVAPPPEAPPPDRRKPPALERGRGHIFDRRPNPGAESEALRLRLRERLQTVDDAVEDCLARHSQEDPSLAEGVMLVFTLDARGLQDVWIEDHPDVGASPLACLSQAVHGVDWTGLTHEPLQMSRRMRTRTDAGLAPERKRPFRL
jgi:hypothetical protein